MIMLSSPRNPLCPIVEVVVMARVWLGEELADFLEEADHLKHSIQAHEPHRPEVRQSYPETRQRV